MPQCAVATCRNSHRRTRTEAVRYHRFPRPVEVRERWVTACGRIANNNGEPPFNISTARICSIHFEDDFYERDESCGEKRSRLKPGAVPTLHVPVAVEPFQDMMRMNEEKRLAQAALKLNSQQKLKPIVSQSQCNETNKDQKDEKNIEKSITSEITGDNNGDIINIANNISNCINVNLNINVTPSTSTAPSTGSTSASVASCSNTSRKVKRIRKSLKKETSIVNADSQRSNIDNVEKSSTVVTETECFITQNKKVIIEEPKDPNDIRLKRKSISEKDSDKESHEESSAENKLKSIELPKLPFSLDEPSTVKQADEREKTVKMFFDLKIHNEEAKEDMQENIQEPVQQSIEEISKEDFMRSLGLVTHAEKER